MNFKKILPTVLAGCMIYLIMVVFSAIHRPFISANFSLEPALWSFLCVTTAFAPLLAMQSKGYPLFQVLYFSVLYVALFLTLIFAPQSCVVEYEYIFGGSGSCSLCDVFLLMISEYGQWVTALSWLPFVVMPTVCAWWFIRIYGTTRTARIVSIVLYLLTLCLMIYTIALTYHNVEHVVSNYEHFYDRTRPFDLFLYICIMGIFAFSYIICYGVAGRILRLLLRIAMYTIIALVVWFSVRAFIEYPLVEGHLNSYDITQFYLRHGTSSSLPGWNEYALNMGIIAFILLCDLLSVRLRRMTVKELKN